VTRVLIVDDEPDILLMLRVNLEADGYETALAADGESALRRIEQEDFDLVLLDVMMPVMDGWSVLDVLQAHPAPPRVIVVSAKSGDKDIARAIQSGAADYVVKPFSPDHLSGLIGEVLRWSDEELTTHRQLAVEGHQ
jgi:DNA-binding response OmpR family regulator